MNVSSGITTRREKPGQDVVVVGGNQQMADREPHALSEVGGKNIAEIAGGYAKR